MVYAGLALTTIPLPQSPKWDLRYRSHLDLILEKVGDWGVSVIHLASQRLLAAVWDQHLQILWDSG